MIGFDVGTFSLVCCTRNEKNDFVFKREINAFLEMPLENEFVFNMMKQAGVPLIRRDDVNLAYALGENAINMAYTMTQLDLKRPMKDGCVNPKEKDAFQIMSIMLHSLIGETEKDNEILYYCVPANAINKETDADYHRKVVEAIFKAYRSEKGYKLDPRHINEAMCLVYAELKDKMYTGLGCSCLCPGTQVYTRQGLVNIEAVQEGDRVLTHQSKWQKVTKVISQNFTGKSTKLEIIESPYYYKFVKNHELYVCRKNVWQWMGCEEILPGDIVGEPFDKEIPHHAFCFSAFVKDNFYCSRVQKVSQEEYSGTVYDLQVEEDHSFSAPFLTIHNCGGGLVNVAFSLFGAPVFTFAIANSGDWIDKQAATATGETIAFINKSKMKIDLDKPPTSLVERAIKTQYELMIEKTVAGIKKGLELNKDKNAKLDHPLDVVLAGGTASPPGFDTLFAQMIHEAKLPVDIGKVFRPADPSFTVAKGCLIAAENSK